MMLEATRSRGRDGIEFKPALGAIGEQLGAHTGNGLDVSAYRCVGVAARNRKNYCVHRSPLCPVANPVRAVDSTRTQPFVPILPMWV
jgi:hypothetical protein